MPLYIKTVAEEQLNPDQTTADDKATRVDSCVREDLMAFEELFVPHMPQLYHAASQMLRNHHDSEDAVQDGLLAAFRHFDQFQGRSQLSTWLHSIVRNAARMQLRKRRRSGVVAIANDINDDDGLSPDQFIADPAPNPEQQCAERERLQLFLKQLRRLPPIYRAVVQMCIVEGLLRREAAQRLGVSIGTVKARLRRASALLVKYTQPRPKEEVDRRRRAHGASNSFSARASN
jgi:RNA polymerase sigma-70 factor (ECF subfamily)